MQPPLFGTLQAVNLRGQVPVLCGRLSFRRASLQDSEEKRRAEYAPDRKASAKTAEAAKAMGIRFEGLVVRGKSRKRLSIYGISPGGLGVSAVKLQKEFSAACGTSFGVPSLRMDGENGCGTLEMESRQRFSFTYAGASRRKEGENVCGDQYRFFKGKDGSFYGILSDGMGSGRDAAVAAGSARLSEKLSVAAAVRRDRREHQRLSSGAAERMQRHGGSYPSGSLQRQVDLCEKRRRTHICPAGGKYFQALLDKYAGRGHERDQRRADPAGHQGRGPDRFCKRRRDSRF